jgi:Flp pilus assembly protein TadG
MVEMALILVVMVALAVGLVNFALMIKDYTDVSSAAGAGAIYASQGSSYMGNLSGIQTATIASNGGSWHCVGTPTVSSSAQADAYGQYSVTVTMRCNVASMIPMVGVPTAFPVSYSAARQVKP